ncbi:murein hydrolase activator EnvC family protein [Lutispora sp.]|uniref:murein hydrolase activator EnvC family protein n=1 Tax=Lutispora sp. TaxID=2828727 RepID=UPI0035691B1F
MKYKKSIALLLAIILCLSVVPVYGQKYYDDVKDLQKQLEETRKKIELTKAQQAAKQKESKNVSNQIVELDRKLEEAEKSLEIVEGQISELEGKIAITQRELDRATEEAETQKELLNKRVRVMYQNGSSSYLAVLLNATSFSDFISRLDLMRKIINYDVNLLKERKTIRDNIDQKKQQLEYEQQQKEVLKNDLSSKKEEVESVKSQKEQVLKEVYKDLKELERQEDKLLEESAALTKKILQLQSSEDYIGGEMAWPSPGYTKVTSPYGYRTHPILKTKRMHTGVDLAVPSGSNIVAANAGKVILAKYNGGYGNTVIIDHGGKISTLYAHNSKLLVKEGDIVTRGQVIAKSGSTGLSTGPHLHFEVRINGNHTDPIPYITKSKK